MRGEGRSVALVSGMKNHPLLVPVSIVVIGGSLCALLVVKHGPIGFLGAAGFPLFVLTVGLLLLPFGIATVIRRRIHPLVLRCPRCGITSREADQPFGVERPKHVDYTRIVCSQCLADFTVDKFSRLIG